MPGWADLEPILDQWREKDIVKERDDVWGLSLKWDSLQPQRKRLIEPIPYVIPITDVNIDVEVKIFADSLPKPLSLTVSLDINLRTKKVSADDLLLESRTDYEASDQSVQRG